ncbi:trigger factor [Propioniciclava soli]|uniref:Trigger factor n=1 Tax=Propioniciclava soli TaxID=2775081 RepID=A0ABZ3C4D3_9ACTN
MPSTVEKLSPSRVKLTIEIPFADLKPHLDKAYREISSQVTIPGFRKGKVPPAVIDRRFGRGAVLQDAINDALPDAYGQAVSDNDLTPLDQPEIEMTKLEDNDLVEFTAEVDVRPDFEVPAAADLTAEVPPLTTSDADVDERIEVMRQRFATRSDVERAASEGDVVTIDLEARVDGELVEGGAAEGVTYTIGTGGMLDGLDEAVTGLSAGESADFSSELVGGPAQGQTADVHVTVTKVQTEELPEVDDEFAQLVSEFDTVEEMRADLADAAVRIARLEQLNAARDAVVADLAAKTDFELPEGLVASEIENRKQQISDQLARAGYTVERYLEESEDETAENQEEFWAQVEENARTSLKAQIILDKLAETSEVPIEQSDLTEMLFRRAQASGTSPEQEMQHMMEHNHTAEWMGEVRRNKVLTEIVKGAHVTDTNGEVVDVAAIRTDGTLADAAPAEPTADAQAADDQAVEAPTTDGDDTASE